MSDTVVITEDVIQTVDVDNSETSVYLVETPPENIVISGDNIEIVSIGVQGPPGPSGTGDLNYSFPFNVASTVQIAHNLGKYPSVTVIDSAGDEVDGSVTYEDANNLTITFSAPFSGVAKLN